MENKEVNNNPKGNIGAIFAKKSRQTEEEYFLIKATLDGKNFTLVGFKNKDYIEGDLTNKQPAFYLFPYKAKEEGYNK